MRKLPATIATVVPLLLVGAGCGSASSKAAPSAGTAQPTATSSAASASSGTTAPLESLTVEADPIFQNEALIYGISSGIFRRDGLDVKTVASTPENTLPLVLNGEAQIGSTGSGQIITMVTKNVPVQMIGASAVLGGTVATGAEPLVVAKGTTLSSLKDLAGKTVAVNGLQSPAQASIINLVKQAGGDPSAIKWVAVPFAGQPAAMAQGRVSVAAASPPFSGQMVAQGATRSGVYSPAGDQEPEFFVTKTFLASHTALLHKFIAALSQAFSYANSHIAEMKADYSKAANLDSSQMEQLPNLTWNAVVQPGPLAAGVSNLKNAGFISSAPTYDQIVAAGFRAPNA